MAQTETKWQRGGAPSTSNEGSNGIVVRDGSGETPLSRSERIIGSGERAGNPLTGICSRLTFERFDVSGNFEIF